MPIPVNIIANADDFGLNASVNRAILYCFEKGYINSTSILTNTIGFEEAVQLIHSTKHIVNIGIHINLAEGKPLTNIDKYFLDNHGSWNVNKTNSKFCVLNNANKQAFEKEIAAQVDRALSNKIALTHIDAHYHLHTLPCFYKLFINAARHYKLKIRLAQTYNEGNYLKYTYRKYINKAFVTKGLNYSDRFENVEHFLKKDNDLRKVEVMLHPDFDDTGVLTDSFDKTSLTRWLAFVNKNSILTV